MTAFGRLSANDQQRVRETVGTTDWPFVTSDDIRAITARRAVNSNRSGQASSVASA
jgi:hypothetical protein